MQNIPKYTEKEQLTYQVQHIVLYVESAIC